MEIKNAVKCNRGCCQEKQEKENEIVFYTGETFVNLFLFGLLVLMFDIIFRSCDIALHCISYTIAMDKHKVSGVKQL